MEDNVELVIKMPEKLYKHIMSTQFCVGGLRHGKSVLEGMLVAIRTGTPLPKGHGRLIDADDVTDFEGHYITTDAPTIIEADESEET